MRIPIICAAVVALLAFGQPADAKGPTELTITGVGLERPIVLGTSDDDAEVILTSSRFFDVAMTGDADMIVTDRAPGRDLGPRLRLIWTIPWGDGDDTVLLRQDLYPYTAGGPVLFIAAGQSLYGQSIASGWYRAEPGLVGALQRVGVPAAGELQAAADTLTLRWLSVADRAVPN